MKKIKFIAACYIAISFSISSCTSLEPNAFVIYGTTDHADGSSVYRIISGPNGQPVTIDSTKVVNGSFELKGTLDQIDINFIFLEGVNGNVPVILEEGSIEMEIFKDSLASSITAGTPSNNNLAQYRESTQGFAKDMRTLVQEINEANTLGDNILAEDLTAKYKAVETNLSVFEKDFMNSNPQSYVATLILERLVTTKAMRSSEAKLIYNGFDPKIKSSVSGKKVEAIINVPSNPTAIGEVAPAFEGPTPTGELVSLASLKGKVTIIDFWASWCRPCRIENPNLVRLYKRMHDKGLEIVGVSLDKNQSSWARAIEDDGLSWNHVSNLKYWQDPIALLYGVRSIPAAFVLNKEGVIVAKNLRGAQLDAKIEELLSE
ncbi:MAG: redoxin domain-containing protein [Flavobacteriales bacterium]|jgi:peroxiredoxin|tara:strand:+ start:1188 stop:2312 length:1125 start_codon:yes stop_codon:yes gene_type:complete